MVRIETSKSLMPRFRSSASCRVAGVMPIVTPWWVMGMLGCSQVREEITPSAGKGWERISGRRCFKDTSFDQVESLNPGAGWEVLAGSLPHGGFSLTPFVIHYYCHIIKLLFSLVEASVYLMVAYGFHNT